MRILGKICAVKILTDKSRGEVLFGTPRKSVSPTAFSEFHLEKDIRQYPVVRLYTACIICKIHDCSYMSGAFL